MISAIVTSTGGLSMRRRTNATRKPTIRPIATPPTTLHTSRQDASQTENVPATAAVTATRYRTSAVPSFTRLSPSTMVMARRGTPSRRMIAEAASGSVGATTAPRTKAALQDMSSTIACATTATAVIVTSTSPIASVPIGRMFSRSSRNDVKNAAE